MFIPRPRVTQRLLRHLGKFPAAGLVGARQVGKTTLVKELVGEIDREGVYLDLQQPSARARLLDA